jgi:uncharacterized membrane protein YsdA (DUF1294 family)
VPQEPNKTQVPAGRFGLRSRHVFFLAFLLVAPVIALVRLDALKEMALVVAIILGVSLIAFGAQWIDKRRAETERWRVPEKVLHLLEFLGGWPGAFLAQRIFRHKTAKISYQLIFWLIVLAYEYAAVDFLLGWKITHHIRQLIGM